MPSGRWGIARALRQLHEHLRTQQAEALPHYPPYSEAEGPWHDAGWIANRWAELLPLLVQPTAKGEPAPQGSAAEPEVIDLAAVARSAD